MNSELTGKPKLLLLSGYDAASHRYWRETLEQYLSCFEWVQLALPNRYFSWRIRGNSLSFAFQYQAILEQEFDGLIVTSMVDLASLRGFIPKLASIPTLIYFHENQFAYPKSSGVESNNNSINAQLTSIYSVLCADKVVFNSEYNKRSFFDGANQLLKKLPDAIPKGVLRQAEENTSILPVPIIENPLKVESVSKVKCDDESIIELLWNHRWEYDKQPEVLFKVLAKLKENGFSFKLHVLGQSFRQVPDCFERAKHLFKDEVKTWGFQSRQQYWSTLNQSDIVISTALHDFQGLSMLEAIQSGCYPVAPNRVVYPEYLNDDHLYQVGGSLGEVDSLYCKLVNAFDQVKLLRQKNTLCTKTIRTVRQYLSNNLLEKYEVLIKNLISG